MSHSFVTVTFAPEETRARVPAGTTLLQASREAGREIVTTCGARGRCRSCRVKVIAGNAPPPTLADRIQLGGDDVRERYRLACQNEAADDVTLLIAPALEETAFQILASTGDLRATSARSLDSGVQQVFVRPTPPSNEEHQTSDLEEVLRPAALAVTEVPLHALRAIPTLLRSGNEGLTLTLFDQTLRSEERRVGKE